MHRVEFVTSSDFRALTDDDHRAVDALVRADVHVAARVWTESTPEELDPHTTLVIRSAWDYHLRSAAFREWIRGVAARGIRVVNHPNTLLWNLDKRYLRALESAAIPIIPTVWLGEGRQAESTPGRHDVHSPLRELLVQLGWDEAVFKPTVSASAYETFRVARDDVSSTLERHFTDLAQCGPVMLQPFIAEILSRGEWSLMFFEGTFSHAVVKRAAPGDFRVQTDFGGTRESASAPPNILAVARSAVAAVPGCPAYVRVDGVDTSSGFRVMEVECIDPVLFFEFDVAAPERFARAVIREISRPQREP